MSRSGPSGVVALLCLAAVGLFSSASPSGQRKQADLIAPASTSPDVSGQDRITLLRRLRSRIAAEGEVRLIVQVRTIGFNPLEAVEPNQEDAQRSRIRDAQRRMVERLPQRARRLRAFDTVPFVALHADPATFEALLADPAVISVEEDGLHRPTLAQSVSLVQADDAWAAGYTGAGKVIAVLDTGVDKAHPVFGSRVISEACYSGGGLPADSLCPGGDTARTTAGSGRPCGLDGCEHGTHVAAIAAGSTGVARHAGIIAIQVFSNFGGEPLAYTSDLVAAMERVYALRKKYDIASVNMSLGSGGFSSACDAASPSMAAIINKLQAYRIATIVASGNDGYSLHISHPACIDSAVSVGSTTKLDEVSHFSNTASILDLLAPGSSITAAVPGGGYATFAGTSMAAPHVAGGWALLEQRTPGLTVAAGLAALRNTGLSIGRPGTGLAFSRIRINSAASTLPPLAAAELVEPSGLAGSTTPAYRWHTVGGSTHYRLYVSRVGASAPVVDALYRATDVCGVSTCSVTPAAALTLGGSYTWSVRTFDFGYGPWSAPSDFVPGTGAPSVPTPSSPAVEASTTPLFRWESVPSAAQYQLAIEPAAGGTVAATKYNASAVCGADGCATLSAAALTSGASYRWRVRALNAFGWSGWSSYLTFTASAPPPATAALTPASTVNTLAPVYRWRRLSTSTMYQIYLYPPGGGAVVTSDWYEASAVCGSKNCAVAAPLPLTGGASYTWRVRTRNGGGKGSLSNVVAFQTRTGLPGTATPIAPSGPLTTQFPTYTWTHVSGATRYYLSLRTASGAMKKPTPYEAADVCDFSRCQVTPSTPLSGGSFSWSVQARNGAGYGAASAWRTFSTTIAQVSFVLTWGANPADLDSHLVTPTGHHVYWAARGSATSAPFASLDTDDRNGFGPETVFIHQAQQGSYSYYVRRFAGTGTLAGSGALVKVYVGRKLVGTFKAPKTGNGDYWHVCTVTNAATGARTCPSRIMSSAPAGASGAVPFEATRKR